MTEPIILPLLALPLPLPRLLLRVSRCNFQLSSCANERILLAIESRRIGRSFFCQKPVELQLQPVAASIQSIIFRLQLNQMRFVHVARWTLQVLLWTSPNAVCSARLWLGLLIFQLDKPNCCLVNWAVFDQAAYSLGRSIDGLCERLVILCCLRA